MKDDILTAVMNEHSIAPIAPLPSRLSFCVGPRQPEQVSINIRLCLRKLFDRHRDKFLT
jgi:hypothetical protein